MLSQDDNSGSEASSPVGASVFDALHEREPDPWHVRTRWYERRKADLVMAMLPASRYDSGFEGGCSIGELSLRLATRCDRLLCVDHSAIAARAAAARLREAGHGHARIEVGDLAQDWPGDERFDLIVLSEVLYFLGPQALQRCMSTAVSRLNADGHVVTVNWLRSQGDNPLSGTQADDMAACTPGLSTFASYRDADCVARVLAREGAPSVADRDFLGESSSDA